MEITLPPDLQQYLNDQVSQGIFPSLNDAVRDAVKVLRDRDRRREEILREIDKGLEQLDRGDGIHVPLERLHEFFDEIKNEARNQITQKHEG